MKKFLVLAVVSLLILSVFVACGGEMKDDMTTMMDDMTSMMDAMTSEGRGEVTEDETTEEITEEDLTDEELTTDETTDKLEEDLTEAESKAKNILDDITE